MPWGFAAGAVASIGGAIISGQASQSAANTEAQAAQNSAQVQQNMFNTTQGNLQPYMSAGGNALNQYLAALGLGPGGAGGQQAILQQLQQTPGYQFQLSEGLNAVNNGASAAGGVQGGNNLRALTQYGQGLANNTYSQYLQNLQGLVAGGQNAAANLGGISANVASNIGSNYISAGNALAAGQIGQANAYSNILGGAANLIGGVGSSFSGGGNALNTYQYQPNPSLSNPGYTGTAVPITQIPDSQLY